MRQEGLVVVDADTFEHVEHVDGLDHVFKSALLPDLDWGHERNASDERIVPRKERIKSEENVDKRLQKNV